MEAKEFSVFRSLLTDVHSKAFGEPLSKLPHGKAQTLCWLIYEDTGELLSYKTLGNYFTAIVEGAPERVNPSDATLAILAKFVTGEKNKSTPLAMQMGAYAAWYKYRSNALTRPLGAA
ncbi:MAG: hypothetical protein KIS77_07295 [Saprospiraceae bacterium]|nr:hypothetical protein [Saprospiraceae bacterium]